MELIFRRLENGEMDRPPTQRDQFNNDEVDLAEALVRETLQNSLDAASGSSQVRVRFDVREVQGPDAITLQRFFDSARLQRHLRAAEMYPGDVDWSNVRLLTIEDFGTTGLQGSVDSMDKHAFCDFWRRMGLSHKRGNSLGRWGLGKLVFSSASAVKSFYALTVRAEDSQTGYLMGQAVATTHEIEGNRYDSHGFFAARRVNGMQIPETDSHELSVFRAATQLTRTTEPGLSVIVPFPHSSLTIEGITRAVLKNYFFPILMNQLQVEVGGQEITASTFAALASKYGGKRFASGGLIRFIEALRTARTGDSSPILLDRMWTSEAVPIEQCIGGGPESMRKALADGQPVFARAPLLLKTADGRELTTHVDLFLQRAESGDGDVLFVRDTIVLSAEAKYFPGRNVFAALIATDRPASEFLGDAENPAHTSWSSNAEKVTNNWKNPAARLREIRRSLYRLYSALYQLVDSVDRSALVDVFSIAAEPGVRGGGRKRGTTTPPVRPTIPPPAPKTYRLVRKAGGFALRAADGISADQLPFGIRVRTAYDVLRGNPFTKHSPLDFDLTKDAIRISSRGATVDVQSANVLVAEINEPDFEISVDGFDVQRDLIVDPARAS